MCAKLRNRAETLPPFRAYGIPEIVSSSHFLAYGVRGSRLAACHGTRQDRPVRTKPERPELRAAPRGSRHPRRSDFADTAYPQVTKWCPSPFWAAFTTNTD